MRSGCAQRSGKPWSDPKVCATTSHRPVGSGVDRGVSVAESNVVRLFPRSNDRPATLDVGERLLDIRRLTKAMSLYQRCVRAGWDPDDLDQEILLRLHARQRPGSRSRYNPLRACVSKYICVAGRGIMLNLLDKSVGT